MTLTIEFTNLDEVLDNVIDEHKMKMAMGKACALVEGEAKKKAPKDTGTLRRSITSEVSSNSEGIVGEVFTPLEYAPYVEYGTGLFAEVEGRDTPWSYQDAKGNWHTTSGQKPQPYMRPAMDENKDEVIKMLVEAVKR